MKLAGAIAILGTATTAILPPDAAALASLGPVGVLFAMWWTERAKRDAATAAAIEAADAAKRGIDAIGRVHDSLLGAAVQMERLSGRVDALIRAQEHEGDK